MSNPAAPTVFDLHTLGRAVALGELYDQRSGKFLGVQLYPQDKVKEIVTDIRNTDLTVSLSATYEEKATLLDINAKLSLDILSGLVKVSGSAGYLNDEKSNTHEYAYALALKMRLNEKRILFGEDDLGLNVLTAVNEVYISTGIATHFVSSITYGGAFIVNLVAKQSKLTKEEKIEGKLEVQVNKLKGAVSLEGEVSAKIKADFDGMNDKFDLIIHGDVALDKVPINPQDVLDTFPQASSLICDSGGVPVSVTLQPIPPKLYTAGLIYQLDADFVDDVLKAYSMLDDLTSRFLVLLDGVKSLKDYVPELARTSRVVANQYTREHNRLRHELVKFLVEYQTGGKAPDDSIFKRHPLPPPAGTPGDTTDEDDSEITGDQVLKDATDLYDKQNDPTLKDSTISKQYPASLAGLENALFLFQSFVEDVQNVRGSLQGIVETDSSNPSVQNSFYINNIDDICRAIRIQSEIPVFVMTPLTATDLSPDLAIVRYLVLLRTCAPFLLDSSRPGYMLYAEDLDSLEGRLPNGGTFSELTSPSVFIGEVDSDGTLTWTQSPPVPAPIADLTLPLEHHPKSDSLGYLSFSLDPVDGTRSFSLEIRAIQATPPVSFPVVAHRVEYAKDHSLFLVFQVNPASILFGPDSSTQMGISENKSLGSGEAFTMTFVQDIQAKRWILYLNGGEVTRKSFNLDNEIIKGATHLEVGFNSSDTWWQGQVYGVRAYTRVLTEAEIGTNYQEWAALQQG